MITKITNDNENNENNENNEILRKKKKYFKKKSRYRDILC